MQPTTTRAARHRQCSQQFDGNFRYAVEHGRYGALQFFAEEKPSRSPARDANALTARASDAPRYCCSGGL